MKKTLFSFACGVFASTIVFASMNSTRAVPADLYARHIIAGTCVRLVTALGCPSSVFSDSNPVGSTRLTSVGGSNYTLWDNPACSISGGGKQVAYL